MLDVLTVQTKNLVVWRKCSHCFTKGGFDFGNPQRTSIAPLKGGDPKSNQDGTEDAESLPLDKAPPPVHRFKP